jgi:5,10-methylenetetrahydrofolate reductase
VIAGIWPLTSLRNAEFLANEVPGVVIPPAVLERMRKSQEQGAAAARAEGVAIASEMIEAVKDLVQGVQVSAPSGQVSSALETLKGMTARRERQEAERRGVSTPGTGRTAELGRCPEG